MIDACYCRKFWLYSPLEGNHSSQVKSSEKMFVPLKFKICDLNQNAFQQFGCGHLCSSQFLATFAVFSHLSGALVACLKKISVESWPDLSVLSKFFFFL